MDRRRRYQLAYAAIGLLGPGAALEERRAACRAAWADGLEADQYGAGTAAALELDQAELTALIDAFLAEVGL